MARRNQTARRYGALNAFEFDAAKSGAGKLFDKVLSFKRNGLTVQEIEGVVNPEWLALAKSCHSTIGVDGPDSIEVRLLDPLGRTSANIVTVNVIRKRGQFPFAYSRRIGMPFDSVGTFDPALDVKLHTWAKWRLETACRWAEVRELLHYFDTRCKTPSEVRFYLPCLLTLMRAGGASSTAIEKVRVLKVPKGGLLTLPPEVKNAAIDATTLVNSTLLYPDKVPEDIESQPITLTVDKDYTPFSASWSPSVKLNVV